MKAAKCGICRRNDAIWAMQHLGGDTATYTTLGSHYRGFTVTKVCDPCKIQNQIIEEIRLELLSKLPEFP